MSRIKSSLINTPKSSQEQEIEMCEPRMYLILREDLAYKYIQGGHALAQFALEHRDKFEEWNNEYLINLSVFNGLALQELDTELISKIGGRQIYSIFFEPDLQSPLPTAICIFEDGGGFVSKLLKDLKLATK